MDGELSSLEGEAGCMAQASCRIWRQDAVRLQLSALPCTHRLQRRAEPAAAVSADMIDTMLQTEQVHEFALELT